MSERILNVAIGDTHFGKNSDSFNSKIAAHRLKKFVYQVPKVSGIETVRIHLLGDIVDGSEVYPTHAAMGGDDVPTQVEDAVDALNAVVDHFVGEDYSVEIYGVRGNHGRVSRTSNPSNNFDLMVYWGIAQHVEYLSEDQDKPVYLESTEKEYLVVPDGPLLIHKGISHVGTPARQRLFLAWCMHFKVNMVLSGHWHTPSCSAHNGCWNIVNGALPGPDDFSTPRGWFSDPYQGWFVTREDGSLESSGFVRL